MSIKHIEAGHKGGRPQWFERLPLGTPGIIKTGGNTTGYEFSRKPISLKSKARESLSLIIPSQEL